MPRVVAALAAAVATTALLGGSSAPVPATFPDATGLLATYRMDGGAIDRTGPFFRPLASNGRSCGSCHRPAQGWTIAAEEVKDRFEATQGLDPVFRTSDGSNCDHGVEVSTIKGRRAAYSLLIDRGLIRIALPAPANAEFEVVGVENPYGCGDSKVLSMYRRPLPATNLRFLSTVMWDGRESSPRNPADLAADLAHQALNAASLHARTAVPLTGAEQQAIVTFEMDTATAQVFDREAGALDAGGAMGGPVALATRTMPAFAIGINDPGAGDPHRIKAENAFRLFDDWSRQPYGRVYIEVPSDGDAQTRKRDSIARGQVLFNQKAFDIRGVAGFNDDLHLPSVTGACGTCHNSPNAGNHSVAGAMNTGIADPHGPLDVSYLPVITLRNRLTRETKIITDPGRGLVTGLWKDIGKVKVPVLRGLPARAPWFHNGSARTLADVVDFYDKRFQIGFSGRDKADLIAFLSSL
jgi:cytochrome c peroxidase